MPRLTKPPGSNLTVRRPLAVAALAQLADQQQADHDHERERVEQVDEHVPGMREDDHWFSASDSSPMPSTVNTTMTSSMTIWDPVAERASP